MFQEDHVDGIKEKIHINFEFLFHNLPACSCSLYSIACVGTWEGGLFGWVYPGMDCTWVINHRRDSQRNRCVL